MSAIRVIIMSFCPEMDTTRFFCMQIADFVSSCFFILYFVDKFIQKQFKLER